MQPKDEVILRNGDLITIFSDSKIGLFKFLYEYNKNTLKRDKPEQSGNIGCIESENDKQDSSGLEKYKGSQLKSKTDNFFDNFFSDSQKDVQVFIKKFETESNEESHLEIKENSESKPEDKKIPQEDPKKEKDKEYLENFYKSLFSSKFSR